MNKEELTYKDAMSSIEEIVAKLEDNKMDVDELSTNVKKVSELIKFCKSKLKETEEEVDKILADMEV